VIFSQLLSEKYLIVALGTSFSSLSQSHNQDTINGDFLDQQLVRNAYVILSSANKTDTLLLLKPGVYLDTNASLNNYDLYTLRVVKPFTNLFASATSTMLPKVEFDTISVSKSVNDSTASINFSFTDLPGVENFYMINYYLNLENPQHQNFNSSSEALSYVNKLNSDITLVSDKDFTNVYSSSITFHHVRPTDTVYVALSNISKGYYDFISAREKSTSLFNQLIGEPIHYPSNVVNGYGYFSTHYTDLREFDLNKY
jgi:hypothetical protein